MGAVDLLNQAYFTATRPFDRLSNARLGTRLMRGGTEARGRIDGIKTTRSEASSNQWIWVFSVTVRPGSADPFSVAFQQNLIGGQRQRLYPGAEVRIRHDERRRRALIDWPAMLAGWGHPTNFDTPDSWRPVTSTSRAASPTTARSASRASPPRPPSPASRSRQSTSAPA